MIPADVAAAFFGASVLLALAPGPDNIFVLTQSAFQGRTAGVLVTLGLATGLIVHTSAVALGVAALFRASAAAFTALKTIGALYLLHLSVQAFRARAARVEGRSGDLMRAGALYRRGIIMNVTNPKVSAFFLAFLPPFTDPSRGAITGQIVLLGLLFMVATLLVFGGVALAAGALGAVLRRSPRSQVVLSRTAGVVFLALALNLVFLSR